MKRYCHTINQSINQFYLKIVEIFSNYCIVSQSELKIWTAKILNSRFWTAKILNANVQIAWTVGVVFGLSVLFTSFARSLASSILNSGFWPSRILNSGFLQSKILNSGFWQSKILNSGFRQYKIMNSGFWQSKILNSGFWRYKLLNSGFWQYKILNSGVWQSLTLTLSHNSPEITLLLVNLV